jgi:hypothetical protein
VRDKWSDGDVGVVLQDYKKVTELDPGNDL